MKRIVLLATVLLAFFSGSSAYAQMQRIGNWKVQEMPNKIRGAVLFSSNRVPFTIQLVCAPTAKYDRPTIQLRVKSGVKISGINMGMRLGHTSLSSRTRTRIAMRISQHTDTSVWYTGYRRTLAQHANPNLQIHHIIASNSKTLLVQLTLDSGRIVGKFDVSGIDDVVKYIRDTCY